MGLYQFHMSHPRISLQIYLQIHEWHQFLVSKLMLFGMHQFEGLWWNIISYIAMDYHIVKCLHYSTYVVGIIGFAVEISLKKKKFNMLGLWIDCNSLIEGIIVAKYTLWKGGSIYIRDHSNFPNIIFYVVIMVLWIFHHILLTNAKRRGGVGRARIDELEGIVESGITWTLSSRQTPIQKAREDLHKN